MSEKMKIGYARCSTDSQDLRPQVEKLRADGCDKVFSEKMSGARTDRRELAKAVAALEPGFTLEVTALDRLARSSRDLLNIVHAVTERGANFRSLRESWADTTTPHGKLILTVLGGIAEFERELIRSRTSEGRARAAIRGVKFGPKFKLTPAQRKYVAAERAKGEGVRQIAKVMGVSPATIGRIPAAGDAPICAASPSSH
ncbi:recombinase family protein [Tardiphaga sp. vice154]|uniref:recombinase family protein n=1 Tax=Tardiphaga sp. vice154 TaxID=2592814 RepID=UPI0034A0A886